MQNSLKHINTFSAIATLTQKVVTCGISFKKYELKKEFGIGNIQLFKFNGLSVRIFDALLTKDIALNGEINSTFLELMCLLEGEQIISVNGFPKKIIVENQECYLVYISNLSGSINYTKNKRFKEVKIRMNSSFIEKHHLNSEYNFFENYSLSDFANFVMSICFKIAINTSTTILFPACLYI